MTWFSSLFLAAWSGREPSFSEILSISGEIYRAPEGAARRTLRFERGGGGFFLKLHFGVGWKEIFKDLFNMRLPILGAENEWKAIRKLEQLKIETMSLAGYGWEGTNPATKRSFVITEELENCVSLENYCREWPKYPPEFLVKYRLITRLAEIARRLHANGVNHRDFYLCHFLLQNPWDGSEEHLHLHLIDLHRVQIRNKTPERWIVKDIGSLLFSSMDIGLSQRDLFRFLKVYFRQPLRIILQDNAGFLCAVERRADALYATRPVLQNTGESE